MLTKMELQEYKLVSSKFNFIFIQQYILYTVSQKYITLFKRQVNVKYYIFKRKAFFIV